MSKKGGNTIQAFWVGIGSLSNLSLSIVSAAILSRYFDKQEYGTYKQILYVYNTLLFLFTAGLPKVYGYFLPRYTREEGRDIIRKITSLLFLGGCLFSLVLFIFSDFIAQILNNPNLAIGLKFFSPIPALLLPTLGINGIFASYKKTIYIAIYNTITRLTMLLCIVLPVVIFKGGYLYAIYGWLAVSVFSFFLAYYFKGIPFKGVKRANADLNYKQIFDYSLPLVIATLGGVAIKAADQFYISRYFGPEIFADFSNGFTQLPFVAMITGAAATVLMPKFSKLYHEKNQMQEILLLFKNTIKKSATLIYPLVVFFFFTAKEFIVLLYSDLYIDSTIYFKLALSVNFFNIILFTPIILALGATRFYAKIHLIFSIIAWGLGYVLLQLFFSPVILASFSVLNTILIIVISMRYVTKKMNVKFIDIFPLKSLILIIGHSVFIAAMIKFIYIYFTLDFSDIFYLGSFFFLFVLLLIGTGRILKINYLIAVQPLIDKITNYGFINR